MKFDSVSTAQSPLLADRPSRARFGVLALIAAGTMINYLDRTALGVATPSMSASLHITPTIMGVVFSAFSWSYVASQIPGGWVLDRFGTRLTYLLAITFWSLFVMGQGFVHGVVTLSVCLLGLGMCEAPCFPTNSRVVANWFPNHERAQATAVYTVGEYLGLACFGPALYWITNRFGWQWIFITLGVFGLLFAVVWGLLYRSAPSELEVKTTAHHAGINWAHVRQLLTKRQLWGASIGQFAGNSTLVFFLTWFPTYLARERHMAWIKAGFSAILPFIGGACGVMIAGWVSDQLLKRTGSSNLARKAPIIFGLFGASTIILANFVGSNALVIAILSFAFFSQGMTGLGWALISDVAPTELMGITGGIFNFAANLAGIITPVVIGAIVGYTGSFYFALAYVGATALMGALSYVFILGDVKRIVLD